MLNSLHSSRKRIEIDTATDNGVGFVTNEETTNNIYKTAPIGGQPRNELYCLKNLDY